MYKFKDWLKLQESCIGYTIADLSEKLGKNLFERDLFGDEPIIQAPQTPQSPEERIAKGEISGPKVALPKKQLKSAYTEHSAAIRAYAAQGADQFAQTLLFSPLSAHAQFQRHWDNFQTLMMILKHYFPQNRDVDPKEIEKVLDSFSDKYFTMASTIAGHPNPKKLVLSPNQETPEKPKTPLNEKSLGKFSTIAYVWGHRQELKTKLEKLAAAGKWGEMMEELVKIPNVAPIKAGFAVQMLFGHLGCLDIHNINIYKQAFPDLFPKDLDSKSIMDKYGVVKKGGQLPPASIRTIHDYINTLEQLEKKGIGTQQLWDVWTEFMQNFYKMTSGSGYGVYSDIGRSLDPTDPAYTDLRNKAGLIPKSRVAQLGGGSADVPVATGRGGRGPSATHLQADPDDMLVKFHKIYNLGEPGDEGSTSIPFYSKGEKPAYPDSGLGNQPSLLHYFNPAIRPKSGGGFEVDPDQVKDIIRQKIEKGGPKAARQERQRIYGKPNIQAHMF
jgi:hypothetical protein